MLVAAFKAFVSVGLVVLTVFCTVNALAARSAAHTGEWWSFLGKYVSPTEASRYQWVLGVAALAAGIGVLLVAKSLAGRPQTTS